MSKISKLHIWRRYEDEMVCACVLAHKTDDTTIKSLANLFGLTESQVSFRMRNYIAQRQNLKSDWHVSAQERRVFNALSLI